MQIRQIFNILLVLTFTLAYVALVRAEQNIPLGASNVTVYKSTSSTNASLYPAASTYAEAGNLSELEIVGYSQTKAWQGFYGNVTGVITLEDVNGFRFYDWNSAEPKGEVYASVNNTISWLTVACAPTMVADSIGDRYLYDWNTLYGINASDYDQINNTYNRTDHPTFYVGSLTQTGCPSTFTFVSDNRQFDNFPAILLTSDANSTLIYTAILENKTTGVRAGVNGFDGLDHDFQLLVGEDGHLGNDALTTYYFWVELQ
jgi:hypothetical protein